MIVENVTLGSIYDAYWVFLHFVSCIQAIAIVCAVWIGMDVYKKLPEYLRKKDNKLCNFLLYDFKEKRCPKTYEY